MLFLAGSQRGLGVCKNVLKCLIEILLGGRMWGGVAAHWIGWLEARGMDAIRACDWLRCAPPGGLGPARDLAATRVRAVWRRPRGVPGLGVKGSRLDAQRPIACPSQWGRWISTIFGRNRCYVEK